MGCNSCLQAKEGVVPYYTSHSYVAPECTYEMETIIEWKNKLFCVRDSNKLSELNITKQQLNAYLGIVLSAVNMGDNLCFIKDKLDTVQPFIMKIVNLGTC